MAAHFQPPDNTNSKPHILTPCIVFPSIHRLVSIVTHGTAASPTILKLQASTSESMLNAIHFSHHLPPPPHPQPPPPCHQRQAPGSPIWSYITLRLRMVPSIARSHATLQQHIDPILYCAAPQIFFWSSRVGERESGGDVIVRYDGDQLIVGDDGCVWRGGWCGGGSC
ncbi:hypothetical protein EX30DRAFT_241802 [Ascodesmis nigricans]|uniref:Uncharacterized protein n=1 Tax=Ascodesmis nigricans TaxID=341454 RepID=A0A4S2MZB2_9PEZI|nr:hypothetical protein EX30DRAFT_241802 [Ascodesmis nigricans]